jgi:hypothetical protein
VAERKELLKKKKKNYGADIANVIAKVNGSDES